GDALQQLRVLDRRAAPPARATPRVGAGPPARAGRRAVAAPRRRDHPAARPAVREPGGERLARAYSVPAESECALDSLIGAYPYRRTGVHFAAICASASPRQRGLD